VKRPTRDSPILSEQIRAFFFLLGTKIMRHSHKSGGRRWKPSSNSRHHSPAGPLLLIVSEKGLAGLEFDRGKFPPKKSKGVDWQESNSKTQPYLRELREYFDGRRRDFTFPLDLRWHSLSTEVLECPA
jgi:hypothetical protein